jgi:hypothetical protein
MGEGDRGDLEGRLGPFPPSPILLALSLPPPFFYSYLDRGMIPENWVMRFNLRMDSREEEDECN